MLLKGRQSGSRPHVYPRMRITFRLLLSSSSTPYITTPPTPVVTAAKPRGHDRDTQSWRLVGLNHGIPFARQDGSREKSTCTLFLPALFPAIHTHFHARADQQSKL